MPVDVEPPPLPLPPPPIPGSIPWRIRPHVGDESSWASLVRIVREEDETQIERCQEKLNTYITFSGLFSIAISVLLVDSFRTLQPNYAAMTVELLSQMAAQSQSSSSHIAPLLTSYLPSQSASCVNTLWTASLGVSILGVSLGFLLKQWLCELVRPNSSSPQAELRTRHTRRADWGVVELVTVLPFGAQISMALFFAGLCILTFDVNRAASYTAISMAASWATLFALVVVSPILHPQCPYKLPFTEPIAFHIRTSLYRSLSTASGSFLPAKLETAGALEAGYGYSSHIGALGCEEADIDVFVAIYSKRREAHILNIMWDALKENGATPENLLSFVQKVIYSAHPPSTQDGRGYEKLAMPVAAKNLRSVPNSAYCTLLDNVADLLQDEFLRQTGANDSKPIEWSSWMKEALCIIFADSPYALSSRANAMLEKLMNEDRAEASFDIIVSSLVLINGSTSAEATADHFSFIFDRIQGVMKMIPTQNCAPCLSALLRRCFGPQQLLKNDFSQDLLAVLEGYSSKIPSTCLQLVASLVMKRLTDDLYSSMYWYHHIVDLFESLLFIDDVLSSEEPNRDINNLHDRMVKMTGLLLAQGRNTSIFMCYASGLTNDQSEVLVKSAGRLYIDAFVTSTAVVRRNILSNIGASLQWQQFTHPEHTDNNWDRFVRLHVTKTYLLVLEGVQELQKRGLLPEKDTSTMLLKRISSLSGLNKRAMRL
ncbi:hypothetical protein BC629DRAFT_236532 [Irpex lacteus]|nr:hypothetical protein BC629DRAFT_236532 [Irpex lacteus]